jgi:DNA polymerase-3 subunit delta
MAEEWGMKIDEPACEYLHRIVGNSLRDLYGECEKIYLRYGAGDIGLDKVTGVVIHSRIYTIFELMKMISSRKTEESLTVLTRFLSEEDSRGGPLRIIGMLNRQIRLLWLTKAVLTQGGGAREASRKLGVPYFSAEEFVRESVRWSPMELEKGLMLIYEADGRLKAGARPVPIFETLIFSLCCGVESG